MVGEVGVGALIVRGAGALIHAVLTRTTGAVAAELRLPLRAPIPREVGMGAQ